MPPKAPPVFVFLDPVNRPSAARSAKARKVVRSHVTAQQHRSRKHQEKQESEAFRARQRAELEKLQREEERGHDGEHNNDEEHFDELLPVVSPSSDLSNPLTAAFRGGTLAFQLYILNDPANNVGKILNGLGTDALTVLVNITPLHSSVHQPQQR